MSGPTLELTPDQEHELRRYSAGTPRKPLQRPGRNLLRRGLLDSARTTHGVGWYRITSLGRAALERWDEG